MEPIVLRRIAKNDYGWLTNCCWLDTDDATPMVGSTFCCNKCPYHKGVIRLLFWKFVKCGFLE